MEFFVSGIFLATLLALLITPIRDRLYYYFYSKPAGIFMVPWTLAMLACGVGAPHLVANLRHQYVIPLIFIYTFVPTFVVSWNANKFSKPLWADFLVILMLWLPIEIANYYNLLWIYFGRSAHILSSGTAVTLGLFLFLFRKPLTGLKYNLPRNRQDFTLPLYGLIISAIVLIPLGVLMGFMGPFNISEDPPALKVVLSFLAIFLGIAIPEEILFRGLIQNWLVQKLGDSNKTILIAAMIFGFSHINNFSKLRNGFVTGAPPNWKYVAIATVAGFIYGKVFQKSNTVFASAGLHASVNLARHAFFG